MFSRPGVLQHCEYLYLIILLTSAFGKFFTGIPPDPGNSPNALGAVAGGGKKFRINIAIGLISHVCIIALAGLLYLALSPNNNSL